MTLSKSNHPEYSLRQKTGFFFGIPVFLTILLLPTPIGFSPEGHRTFALAILIALWWITEAIPIPATSLIPFIFFPAFKVMKFNEVPPIFGTGYIRMSDMAKAGVVINLIGVLLVTAVVYILAITIFGIDPGAVPDWLK